MKEHTLAACQREVDDWIRNVGVRYFDELTNTAILMEEVGELARLISRKFGEQSFKEGEETDLAPPKRCFLEYPAENHQMGSE